MDLPIFNKAVSSSDSDYSSAPIPISALWDQNVFTLSNLDPSETWNGDVGLAEFTNANFVSQDTIFIDYQKPAIGDTDLYTLDWKSPELIDAEDGNPDNRLYLRAHNGPLANIRLAAVGYFDYALLKVGASALITPVLDETVHKDYASVLIPKTVGYNTALLNYFFRGKIEITEAASFGGDPAFDPAGKIYYRSPISTIAAKIKNASKLGANIEPIHAMGGGIAGTITGVACYRMLGPQGMSYKTAPAKMIITLSDTVETAFTFDFSADLIPGNISDLAIMVVYRGTLGAEEVIAVAVGRKELAPGLEISSPAQYVYSIVDGSTLAGNPDYLFTKVKARVRNSSPNGGTLTGSLKAVAEYRRRTNYSPDLANDPPYMAEREALSSFSESATLAGITVETTTAQEFTFDFSAHPIPAGITDLYLYVVYEAGGNQQTGADITFALGRKDLNEPQHLTFWNDTDYFLLNGQPRLATDIQNDPSAQQYGFIWPHDLTEYLGFAAEKPTTAVPLAATIALPPSRHSRILILTDSPTGYWVADKIVAPANNVLPANGYTFLYTLNGVVNQEEPTTTVWKNTIAMTVRGVSQHQRSYYMNSYPYFLYINSLPSPLDLTPQPAQINY